MYIEPNKVEKMVSFLDVGPVSSFGRRRTVTEAGFVSIIEDILPLTTPGIVDMEQEQRKRGRRRKKEENVESRSVPTRTNTSHLPSFHLDLLRKSSYPSISSISFLVARLIFLFQPRRGKRISVKSRF